MKRNLRDKSISLLLAVAMVFQTILPTLVSAQEKASPQPAAQGLETSLEEKDPYTITVDPRTLEADSDAKTLTLQFQKREVKEAVIAQTEQAEQEGQTQAQDQVSTLVYHKSLALTDQTLKDLEAIGYKVETQADLQVRAQEESKGDQTQTTDQDLASEMDLITGQGSDDTPVILSESQEIGQDPETGQDKSDLPDYGPDYDYIRLTLTPEAQETIQTVLEAQTQYPTAYDALRAKAGEGKSLTIEEEQTLAILDHVSYTEEKDPDTQETTVMTP